MTVAVYAGSFDPITNGHLDIAARAVRLFDKLIIGVYDTPAKNLMFSTNDRVELVRQSIVQLQNVEVQPFTGLIVDFARRMGARAIVRGLRAVTDFENEFEMAMMNKKLAPDCDVVCLMANLKYAFLSSSRMKEVARLGGNIDDLVPQPVADALKKKIAVGL
ncbi:MAG: pantetheine-phosphate adenylyltransferase [Chloroflexi bacterium RBG_16_57_8]|nr:MAG: pantetheine-phosphate adenylyltransferase [Chloroflexi bacterium RBG_16_57_8]